MLPGGEIALGKAAAPVWAFLGVAPAVILTAAGLLARWSHPRSWIGVLLVVEGLAWNVGTLAYSTTYIPAASEISALTGFVAYAIGGHILLSYPSGRLRSNTDRVLVGLLYLAFGPAVLVGFAFHASYGPGCPCLANAFLTRRMTPSTWPPTRPIWRRGECSSRWWGCDRCRAGARRRLLRGDCWRRST
jgi:hypothetical protein